MDMYYFLCHRECICLPQKPSPLDSGSASSPTTTRGESAATEKAARETPATTTEGNTPIFVGPVDLTGTTNMSSPRLQNPHVDIDNNTYCDYGSSPATIVPNPLKSLIFAQSPLGLLVPPMSFSSYLTGDCIGCSRGKIVRALTGYGPEAKRKGRGGGGECASSPEEVVRGPSIPIPPPPSHQNRQSESSNA